MPKPYPGIKSDKLHIFRGSLCRMHAPEARNVQNVPAKFAQKLADRRLIMVLLKGKPAVAAFGLFAAPRPVERLAMIRPMRSHSSRIAPWTCGRRFLARAALAAPDPGF